MLTFTLSALNLEQISALCAKFAGRMTMSMGENPALTLRLRKGEDVLRIASRVAEEFDGLLRGEAKTE